jgi:predicted Zn-dependent protease
MSCSFRRGCRLALVLLASAPAACGAPSATAKGARTPTSAASPAARRQPQPTARSFVSPYRYEWFIRAEVYAATGRYAEAVEAYQMALTSADDDPYVFARLAQAEDQAGENDAAARTLAAGLALDPQSEAIWLARARIAERHGDVPAALEAYERAEAAAPSAPDAPFALAALLRRTGHPGRASAVLDRFAARNATSVTPPPRPFAVDPRLALDTALAFHDAARVEHLLATTPPDQLGGPVAAAEAYLAIDRPARALELLAERSTANDPDPHRRSLVQAQALLLTGRPTEAATLAAAIPKASAHHHAATRVLALALEAAALPALARELDAGAPAASSSP